MKLPQLRTHRVIGAAVLSLSASVPAQATLILSAGNVTAAAGSTGNALDVTLTNTGPAAIALGDFSLEISVADTDVSFTSASTATSLPYVFSGDSLFGPDISASPPGQTFDASDACIVCGSTIASGATVGLAHILFDALAGAQSAALTVSIAASPATSLADTSGVGLAATLQNGTVVINGSGSSIPEPSTLVLFSLPALLLARRFRNADAAGSSQAASRYKT
jgi:hypothetical protein